MRKLIYFLTIILLTTSSCEFNNSETPQGDLTLEEVEYEYNKRDHEGTSTGRKDSELFWHIVWESARMKKIPTGKAFIFDLDYDESVWVQDEDAGTVVEAETSYRIMAYKQDGRVKIDVLKYIPSRITSGFTGTLLIEDLNGSPQRSFLLEEGRILGERKIIDPSEYESSNGRVAGFDQVYVCTTTIYMVCNGEGMSNCREQSRSTTCVLKEVVQIAPDDPYSGDGSGGGNNNGNDTICENGIQDDAGNCVVVDCGDNYVLDENGECRKKEEGIDCASFNFKSILDDVWWETGVDNIRFRQVVYDVSTGNYYTKSFTIRRTVYFGLPRINYNGGYMSSGEASALAAAAVQHAMDLVHILYKSNPSTPTATAISSFMSYLQSFMISRGGRADYMGSGISVPVSDARYTFLGNGNCN